jgi:hypothetical protein
VEESGTNYVEMAKELQGGSHTGGEEEWRGMKPQLACEGMNPSRILGLAQLQNESSSVG